jgi:hypothetical protein
MYRPGWIHARVELDFAESAFIAGDVLLQQSKQRFSLLRAEVNALKVANLDVTFGLLLQCPENHKEVPDIHSHLHTIGVGFAVIGGIDQLEVGLGRNGHRKEV